ncbi:MAG TPA: MFS transporter [Myxococcota bacterium]
MATVDNKPLIALAAASFCIGTSEFVIMGLLPEVATDLRVDLTDAGLLVTGYALGVVIGAPLLAVATAKADRRKALLGLIGLFTLGNLLCALSPTYALLMAARVVTALSHGAFFGIGSVVASELAAPGKQAQAIALMFSGLTLANVLGVPFGTALGQSAGWRATFFAVTAIGVVATLALWRQVPRQLKAPSGDVGREVRALFSVDVFLPLFGSVLASISFFTVFTYITPMLRDVGGFSPRNVTWVLLALGGGMTVGSAFGGRIADWKPHVAVIISNVAVMVLLLLLGPALSSTLSAVSALMVWSAVGFTLVPILQMLVVDSAKDAPNLASTLNQGAFNLGNATGAWLASAAIDRGVGLVQLPSLAAVANVAGVVVGVVIFLRRRR